MKKTNEEYRDEIRTLFIEKQWLKGYNIAMEFYHSLDQRHDISGNNLYCCYIYLSIGARRLGRGQLAVDFGKNALKYATNNGEQINASREMANCYVETKSPLDAIKAYDNCIRLCDSLLDDVGGEYDKESMLVFEGKADCIHNKGDLLNDYIMLEKSIVMYKQLLSHKNTNIKALNGKISNAYKNINRVHTQLFTPLALAF